MAELLSKASLSNVIGMEAVMEIWQMMGGRFVRNIEATQSQPFQSRKAVGERYFMLSKASQNAWATHVPSWRALRVLTSK